MNNLAVKQETGIAGLEDVLTGAKQAEPSATKSRTPIWTDADKETKDLAKEVYDAKVSMDSAKNRFVEASRKLLAKVLPYRIKLCQREWTPSVKVPAVSFLVGLTWTKAFHTIERAQKPALMNIVGADKYPVYFEDKWEIKIDDVSEKALYKMFCYLAPDDGATEDGIKIGQARFKELFKVKGVIKATETFARDFLMMSDDQKAKLELNGVVPNEASVKIR